MKLQPLLTLLSLAFLATGCGETVMEKPANSVSYYSKHLTEALQVNAKCVAFQNNEFSVMTPSKQHAWKETTEGINCANAETAKVYAAMAARHQRMIDADAPFQPAPEKKTGK
ncbi:MULTISPECIES: hypothetical protein [unclassified Duganella]|uniref:hypothetical protein n=1 Tax=unclassified Duganella TaxID=2636909 RepID=UPI0011C11B6A|nr:MULTISPECIES: hypothetical protein [unclassified Duganella]